MSSSGEEVDFDDFNDSGHSASKTFRWNDKTVKKLVTYVLSNVTADALMAPYDTVDIDWDEVEDTVGVDAEKCKQKWTKLLMPVRKHRTLPEIIGDLLSKNSDGEDNHKKVNKQPPKRNASGHTPVKKKKKKVNPDHPKRPRVNGYSIFWSEVHDKMAKEGRKGVSLMLTIGNMWKELPDEEKAQYNAECAKQKENYTKEVEEYAHLHPDDAEIQEILAEEMSKKLRRETGKKPNKRKAKKEEEEVAKIDSFFETAECLDDSVTRSPDVKKKKRKKNIEKSWTAEDSFMETKFEEYKEDHPDLSDEEVKQKLVKKFQKLSERKLAKYKRMAEEKNS